MQIPWLFPDFSQYSFFPWPSTKFPDFSLVWNFPDFSLTAGHPAQCHWFRCEIDCFLPLMNCIKTPCLLSQQHRSNPEGENCLTLKQLGHSFKKLILFSHVVHYEWNVVVWNYSNTMNIWSTLWILMAWCSISTRTSVATVLNMHLCVSSCLRLNSLRLAICISKLGYQWLKCTERQNVIIFMNFHHWLHLKLSN